jgi:hypothetical protein
MSPAQLDLMEQAIQVRRDRSPADDQANSVAAAAKTTQAEAASSIQTTAIQTIEAAFQAEPSCPHCQSRKLQKWGAAHDCSATAARDASRRSTL